MSVDSAKYLWDAVQAAERVARFAAGMNFEGYHTDEIRRSAIERQLEILCEALAQLRKVDANLAVQIDDLPRAIALRNVLIHGYASADEAVVWGVVEQRLGALSISIWRKPRVPTRVNWPW